MGRTLTLVVAVSCVAGLVLAGLLLPVVGGLGLGAKSAVDTFDALPADLTLPDLAQKTNLYDAKGHPIADFFSQNRVIVPLKDVPLSARQAIVAIEDSRFYEDEGIDVKGIMRAAVTNAGSGDVRQGGSTLTQQLVKNALLESASTPAEQRAATADTLSRKVREMRYAIALAHQLSKDQILQDYLNIVYFGEGTYGISAAARHYFGVSVEKLSLPQSAMLAGLVRNPSGYDPVRHPTAAKDRRDTVLARMAQLAYISPATARTAESAPLKLHVTAAPNGCEDSSQPFFCDYVVTEFLQDPRLGATVDDRRQLLSSGGLTIQTTLDPTTQAAAQHAVDTTISRTNRIATAAVTVQPGTGAVVGMAVDRTYGHSKKPGVTSVNYATGGQSGFQAGSTFKAFVLADAIRKGIPLSLTLNAPHSYTSTAFPDDKPYPYPVSNAGDSEAGVFDMVTATWLSVNTWYLQLEERTGAVGPAQLAGQMGVRLFPDKPLAPVASFFLGTNAVSPLAMAGAYATFAAHGQFCAPYGISRVTDSTGKVLLTNKPQCTQVLDAKTADTVTSVLQGVIDGPNPLRTGIRASIGRPAAGKTGTTDNEQMAWFIGYTPRLATAVWVGDPRGPAYPLHDVTADGRHWDVVYGGDLPAIVWQRTMSAALTGIPAQSFALPMALPPPPVTPKPPAKASPTPKPTKSAAPGKTPAPKKTVAPTKTPAPKKTAAPGRQH